MPLKTIPIADAGIIIGLRSDNKAQREWALRCFEQQKKTFLTCEAALAEAAHFCGPEFICALLESRELTLAFSLSDQHPRVCSLIKKHAGQMDLADACLVRMSELIPDCKIYTVDRNDFTIYRRNGDESIPCEIGPRS